MEETDTDESAEETPAQSQIDVDNETLNWLIEMLPPDLPFEDFSSQLRGYSDEQVHLHHRYASAKRIH